MASSSGLTGSQRRRAHQKKQQLSRSNSSLLSTLKNLVTAPLSWFAGNEEFEDSKGKRRRLASPLEPMSEDEDKASRPKRMRIDRSPTDTGHSQTPHIRPGAYLDPPAHVFKSQRASSVQSVPRSLSLSIPSSTLQELSLNSTTSITSNVRSTLSPLRNLGISRTMSVDPPTRALRREPAMTNIPLNREVSFESAKNPPRSARQRELSAPLMPQSSRTSFHLRSSMTPQPLVPHAQRESSEPPALSHLVINPVFVRAPSSQPADSRQRSGVSQTVTLGSLVDLSRGARSPVRQHSSLGPIVPQPSDIQSQHQESAAEKALHELDIYKTPLVPSRLRLSNEASQSSEQVASSSVLDLFKPRRTSKLVLMHDEKRSTRPNAKHVDSRKAPLTNDTKPYAGEGGMKKLLARHKYEIGTDEEQDQRVQDTVHQSEDKAMDDSGRAQPSLKSGIGMGSSATKTDWFAAASDVDRPLNTASLRVGRDKKRNHIVRPKAKSVKPKFSAAFDEDGDDMMDEGIDDEQEKIGMEDILSSKFVFSPPPGFSFAQNPQSLPDSDDAKELPIPSLPFSLTKSQGGRTELPKPSLPFSFTPPRDETTISQAKSSRVETVDAQSMDISSRVPNFFASSKAFSNSLDIPVAPLNFKLNPPQPIEEHAPSMFPSATSTDASHLPTETEKKVEFKASIGTNDSASTFVLTPGETAPSTVNMSPGPTPLLPHATGFTIKTVTAAKHTTPSDQGQHDDAMQTTQISAAEPTRPIEATDFMNAEAIHPSSESSSSIAKGSGPVKPSLNLLTTGSITTNDLALGRQDFASAPNSNVASKASSVSVSIESVLSASSFAPPTASGEPHSQPFGLTNESAAPKPSFGGFNFQVAGVTDKVKSQAPVGSVVPSSTSSSTVGQPDQKKETINFAFQPQTSVSTNTSLFAFGGGGSVTSDVSKPFSFGSSAGSSLGRPVTPPKPQDQEVQMDESPTRDIQSSNVKPTMSGFSFSQIPTSSSLFGTQTSGNTPSSSPFTFGPSLASNPFATSAKEVKPVQKKPIDFSQTSSFSFGQSNKAPDVAGTVQSPTSAPFSYGPSTNTFAFGPSSASNNPFGQPQAGSAPTSPATFGASSFSFGSSASNTGFMFGSSQPASPVGGSNLSLPQPSTSGFGNSGFGQSAPSSPFSTTSPLAPSAPSAPLFTIGSAPAAAPGAPRQIKKLPSRRPGTKR